MTGDCCRTGPRSRVAAVLPAQCREILLMGKMRAPGTHLIGEPGTPAQMPQYGHSSSSGQLLSRTETSTSPASSATSASAPISFYAQPPGCKVRGAGGGRRARSALIHVFSGVRVGASTARAEIAMILSATPLANNRRSRRIGPGLGGHSNLQDAR